MLKFCSKACGYSPLKIRMYQRASNLSCRSPSPQYNLMTTKIWTPVC